MTPSPLVAQATRPGEWERGGVMGSSGFVLGRAPREPYAL